MTTYANPACGQCIQSEETILDDIQIDRASNGAAKGRAFYAAPVRAFNIVHDVITSAEKATLLSFYNTNRLLAFDFVWAGDGNTYSCRFAAPPQFNPVSGMLWKATIKMVAV